MSAYDRVEPEGIASSAFHTESWNGEPSSRNGVANTRDRPAK
jgi:hypothetical protein